MEPRTTDRGSASIARSPAGDAVQISIRPEKIRIGDRRRPDPLPGRAARSSSASTWVRSRRCWSSCRRGERLVVHELNDDYVSTGRGRATRSSSAGPPATASWSRTVCRGGVSRLLRRMRLWPCWPPFVAACGGGTNEPAAIADAPADPDAPATGTLSVFAYQDTITDALLDPFREANPDLEVRDRELRVQPGGRGQARGRLRGRRGRGLPRRDEPADGAQPAPAARHRRA